MASLKEILKSKCDSLGLDHLIMEAIIQVESHWDIWATQYEQDFIHLSGVHKYSKKHGITIVTETMLQKMSWGLGQIMGGTARSLGFEGQIPALVDPEINLHFCSLYFSQCCRRYSNPLEQIAAYNAGTPRYKKPGELTNQAYVDKVLKVLGVENSVPKT